ncbi:DsbA family protein [Chenggangzhangella methanolivorans]|uniref:DsbA family protein n=1 Tax=Chenggangzhangella methanolivorans TaxID=1437009 RepID=UPI00361FC97C
MAACLGLFFATAQAYAEDRQPVLTADQVRQIVRDYLISNPEVLAEAAQNYKKQQQEKAAAQARAKIAEQRAAIFDPKAASIGPETAKVTIVEFFDFRCGYCKKMLPTLHKVVADSSDVRVIFRDLPILGPGSRVAATASIAARRQRPERYLDLHRALFETNDLSEASVVAAATRLGLDGEQLRKDMADPAIKAELDANAELARGLGVTGTPALILGDSLIQSSLQEGDLLQRIDAIRKSCSAAAC